MESLFCFQLWPWRACSVSSSGHGELVLFMVFIFLSFSHNIKLFAEQSLALKNLIEDEDGYIVTPIPVEVTSDVLESVLMYCEKHSEEPPSGEERESNKHREALIKWDSKYMEEAMKNIELLYNLTNAANYLEIEGLLKLTTQTVADMISGKSPEEIRSILGITNDLTPEEERQIRQQNLWAFTAEIHDVWSFKTSSRIRN